MNPEPLTDAELYAIEATVLAADKHDQQCRCDANMCISTTGVSNQTAFELIAELRALREQNADLQNALREQAALTSEWQESHAALVAELSEWKEWGDGQMRDAVRAIEQNAALVTDNRRLVLEYNAKVEAGRDAADRHDEEIEALVTALETAAKRFMAVAHEGQGRARKGEMTRWSLTGLRETNGALARVRGTEDLRAMVE